MAPRDASTRHQRPGRDPLRDRWKARIPRWYSGIAHLAFNFIVASAGIVLFAIEAAVTGVRPWAWATIPATFVVANVLEWLFHKYPMHRRTRGLERMFRSHALQHHRFYTHERMEISSRQELFFVLFPVQFFAAAVVTGVLLDMLLRVTLGHDVASLAAITLLGYFVLLEWLHLLTHAPSRWFRQGLLRGRLTRFLREHHRVHHNPKLMTRHNFNISFPLADWLLRTGHRRSRPDTVSTGVDGGAADSGVF